MCFIFPPHITLALCTVWQNNAPQNRVFIHSINKVCFSAKKLSKSVHVVDTAADSQCFSMGRTTPKNCPFSGGSQPHLIHGFLGPSDSVRNGISISSAFFVQLTNMPNRYTNTQTDRHTDHATCDTCSNRQCMRCGLKPRPHQQQCPSNIVECYKLNDSFNNVECYFDIVAVSGNNVERNFVLSTKWKQIEHVQFVSTLSKGRNFTIESFDIVAICGNKVERWFAIVAGVDGALLTATWATSTTLVGDSSKALSLSSSCFMFCINSLRSSVNFSFSARTISSNDSPLCHRHQQIYNTIIIINVKSNLAKVRIAVSLPVAAVNSSAVCAKQAHLPAVAGGQCVLLGTFHRPADASSTVPFLWVCLHSHVMYDSLGSHKSALQTASRSVQPFLHSSTACPKQTDRHTDHTTCDICSNCV